MSQQGSNASTVSRDRQLAEQDLQQLFTDTILRVQVHHARAKEERHQHPGKIPIPHYAKACALLDNFPLPPTNTNTNTSTTTSAPYSACSSSLTPQQIELISSLRQDNWAVLARACLEAKDWVQAEAALSRLAALQEQVAGPEFQPRGKVKKKKPAGPAPGITSADHSLHEDRKDGSAVAPDTTATLPVSCTSSSSLPSPPPLPRLSTKQFNAAQALVDTLIKLQNVAELLGKQQLARNMGMRIEKFQARLALETSSSSSSSSSSSDPGLNKNTV